MKGKFNNALSVKVKQIGVDGSLVKIWPSMNEIERNGIASADCVRKCCNGTRKKGMSFGFKWEYA